MKEYRKRKIPQEPAAAVLKVLPARAGAEKAVGAEKVVEVEEAEEVEAKQEAVGEATAEKRKSRYEYRGEEEMAQEVDDPWTVQEVGDPWTA